MSIALYSLISLLPILILFLLLLLPLFASNVQLYSWSLGYPVSGALPSRKYHIVLVPIFVIISNSITVIKHYDQRNLGKKGFFV